MAKIDQETYDKKMELISETYEFAATKVREIRDYSLPKNRITGNELQSRFDALLECLRTFRDIAREAVNKSFQS